MPRLSRAVFAGIPHHITQRGNRREDVFFTDSVVRENRMLRWTWRGLETYYIVGARQSSTLPMSGMWKRSYGQVTGAPPDERGGNRQTEPNVTALHLDSTVLRSIPTQRIGNPPVAMRWEAAGQNLGKPRAVGETQETFANFVRGALLDFAE